MTIYCISIFSRRSFSKFHDTLCLQCGKDMEDVDKRRRFFPGYKKTNICENIELLQHEVAITVVLEEFIVVKLPRKLH